MFDPFDPLDPLDPLSIEACFPGAITGQAEVTCPHCNAIFTVPVRDPLGEESYRCQMCGGGLHVDWGNDTVTQL
ncbi:MAG: hypothetical protein O3A37_13000 [Planctomycetota bacterium]|nr:hypothetical protein [Planctomycetota bacterium]